MLKKETIEKIEQTLKLTAGTLSAAIENKDEADINLPELQVFTSEEIASRDKNQKNEGIKAGKEIGYKEVRTAAGLDETVEKDPSKIADAIKASAVKDAKLAPDEKNKQLSEQVQLLQKQLGDKDVEITTYKEKTSALAVDSKILASFPKERSSVLSDDEYLGVLKGKYGFKEQDGLLVIEKDGQILRDSKTQNPLALKDAVASIFNERNGWLDTSAAVGGRGGDDKNNKNTQFSKRSEVIAHFEGLGKNINGADGKEIVAKIEECAKDPDFKINE